MRVGAINNTNFKQVVETHRKEDKEENQNGDKNVYKTTITWTETIEVPKSNETLQKINYMV